MIPCVMFIHFLFLFRSIYSFEYPYNDPYDPKVSKQVRALDAVMCMTRRKDDKGNYNLFWNTVLAVAANGKVLAETKAAVPALHKNPLAFSVVQFSIVNILYLSKGPHWQEFRGNDNGDTSRRKRNASKERRIKR